MKLQATILLALAALAVLSTAQPRACSSRCRRERPGRTECFPGCTKTACQGTTRRGVAFTGFSCSGTPSYACDNRCKIRRGGRRRGRRGGRRGFGRRGGRRGFGRRGGRRGGRGRGRGRGPPARMFRRRRGCLPGCQRTTCTVTVTATTATGTTTTGPTVLTGFTCTGTPTPTTTPVTTTV